MKKLIIMVALAAALCSAQTPVWGNNVYNEKISYHALKWTNNPFPGLKIVSTTGVPLPAVPDTKHGVMIGVTTVDSATTEFVATVVVLLENGRKVKSTVIVERWRLDYTPYTTFLVIFPGKIASLVSIDFDETINGWKQVD